MKLLAKVILFLAVSANALQAARVKDLVSIDGGRDNQLIGYGLVVGLAGDGDSSSPMTINAVANSLRRFGLTVDPEEIKSRTEALATASMKLGQAMYEAAQAETAEADAAADAAKDEDVVDADFEEIDEDEDKKSA